MCADCFRFYQHVPNKSEWSFGIVWAHASSTDLVHWKKHPHAIEPTEGCLDSEGCFSGCCVEGEDGFIYMLYTGVRLRSKLVPQDLPPEDHDLQLEFIESQLSARAALGKIPCGQIRLDHSSALTALKLPAWWCAHAFLNSHKNVFCSHYR